METQKFFVSLVLVHLQAMYLVEDRAAALIMEFFKTFHV